MVGRRACLRRRLLLGEVGRQPRGLQLVPSPRRQTGRTLEVVDRVSLSRRMKGKPGRNRPQRSPHCVMAGRQITGRRTERRPVRPDLQPDRRLRRLPPLALGPDHQRRRNRLRQHALRAGGSSRPPFRRPGQRFRLAIQPRPRGRQRPDPRPRLVGDLQHEQRGHRDQPHPDSRPRQGHRPGS